VNILHLTSDWKFTGPAEPMLIAGDALRARGHRVDLLCPPAPNNEVGVSDIARDRGVEVPQGIAIERGRGVRLLRDGRDARALRGWMAARDLDVVHVWHSRAHGLALRARGAETALVRAHSDGLPAPAGPRGVATRWMWNSGCDALVCASESCARLHVRARAVVGAVDLERFRPAGADEDRRAARALLGLQPRAPLVGVVARVQEKRRFDLIFEALTHLRAKLPAVRLAVVGRGTEIETVAHLPVAERGIGENVVFAGHRGDDYPELLRGFDALLFLVPGSDGGCRAVMEAAASGVPVVGSRRGALPEIIVDGVTGYCVDEQPMALVAALESLLGDDAFRRGLGAQARRHAESAFAPLRVGTELEDVYAGAVAEHRR
jgi:glycosyltransferase involved in cell wall biosynthesis